MTERTFIQSPYETVIKILTKMVLSFTNIDGKMPVTRFQSAIKSWSFRLLMVFLTFSIVNCENKFNKTESEHEKTDCTAFLIGRITSFFHLKLNCQI